MEPKANRPHYHVWRKARTGRIYYKLTRPFFRRQNARKYAVHRKWPNDTFMVIRCDDPRCAPTLD